MNIFNSQTETAQDIAPVSVSAPSSEVSTVGSLMQSVSIKGHEKQCIRDSVSTYTGTKESIRRPISNLASNDIPLLSNKSILMKARQDD